MNIQEILGQYTTYLMATLLIYTVILTIMYTMISMFPTEKRMDIATKITTVLTIIVVGLCTYWFYNILTF